MYSVRLECPGGQDEPVTANPTGVGRIVTHNPVETGGWKLAPGSFCPGAPVSGLVDRVSSKTAQLLRRVRLILSIPAAGSQRVASSLLKWRREHIHSWRVTLS